MATRVTKRRGPVKDAGRPVERAAPDRADPGTAPAPRPKDAPRTMRELRDRARASAHRAPSRRRTSLREGLRLERVPDPLRARPVRGDRRPRPPQGRPGAVPPVADEPAAARVRPPRDRPAAVRRRRRSAPRSASRSSSSAGVLPLDEAGLAVVRGADPLPALRLRRRRRLRRASPSGSTTSTRAAARAATACSTSPPSRRRSPRSSASSGRVGLDHERHDGGWRRIVIEKPFGHDLDSAQAPEPRGRQGLPRVAGLPHRPLPGQGDRPQPAGLPLRQRDLRAALEPPLRRPRADHGGRVDRHREPRRVLRGDRRRPRRPPEPPAPAGQPRRDGAAGDVRGRCRCATRRSRSCGRSATRPAEPVRRTSSAASTARAGSPATQVPGYRAGAGGRPRVRDGDVRRRAARRSTTGAGPACRSTCAPASACPSARRRSRSSSGRSPTACSGTPARSPTRTCWRSASSPTRGSCCGSAPRSRVSGIDVRSVTMDFTYGSAFNVDSPDAYETLILDALPGRRVAVHPRRRGRGGVEHRRPDHRDAGRERRPPDFPNYEAGTWGPEEADELMAREGRRWRRI